MRVGEVMSAPVRTVKAEDTANRAWELMRLYRIRHLVVARPDGGVAGLLSAADLGGPRGDLVRDGRLVGDLMTKKVVVAAPQTSVREAANLMRGRRVNCLPVVDGRKLQGIVTAIDLLDLIGRGADRPVATSERYVLKNRGPRPHAQLTARRTPRSTRRTAK
jgi:acetoin utilization protein AcuB